jgi:Ser/Thr protein kinase RdoA (MazF antagonist)
MPAKDSRLNAAAEAVGSALGRFAAALESWTHQGERRSAIERVTATLDSHRQRLADLPPHTGKIGALSEVAHVASRQSARKSRPAGRRAASKAKATRSSRGGRRSSPGSR